MASRIPNHYAVHNVDFARCHSSLYQRAKLNALQQIYEKKEVEPWRILYYSIAVAACPKAKPNKRLFCKSGERGSGNSAAISSTGAIPLPHRSNTSRPTERSVTARWDRWPLDTP